MLCWWKLLNGTWHVVPDEIFQFLGSEGQEKVLEGRDRITKWMADVEDATSPYFHDVHQEVLVPYAKYIDGLRAQGHLGAL
jgi:hypothetical protein